MISGLLHKITSSFSQMAQQQVRNLRGQMFDLGVTLLVFAAGLVLLLIGIVATCFTIYKLLQLMVGDVWALIIMSLLLVGTGLGLVWAGRHMEVRASRKWFDRPKLPAHSHEDAARFRQEGIPLGAPGLRPPGPPGPPGIRTSQHASHYSSPPTILDQAAMAKQYLQQTEDQLNQHLGFVRRHPIASAGVALGVGMLLGRSNLARGAMKVAAIAGGKMLLDKFLNSKSR